MPRKTALANESFLQRVRDYLPMEAAVWTTDATGGLGPSALPGNVTENTFYLFDAEWLLAASRAIEDQALEEANGTLLVGIQSFPQFEPLRERFGPLAASLEQVTVIGTGDKPRRSGRIHFTSAGAGRLAPFWLMLYQGSSSQALLLCRQPGEQAVPLEEKRFLGFYTFQREIVRRVSEDVEQLLKGRADRLQEFERQWAISRAVKEFDLEWARQQQAIHAAVRKLQVGAKYEVRDLADDLGRAAQKLGRLPERLPEWFSHD